ncbi:uncharacterized protein LOC135218074 [Macrobrachium nipponense]|uniref:uncharacterized protein LOC135218074 n=1 Tax=Macrobrachium nipponense TaxID=159736 RepID=UPI0030C81EBE
MGNSTSSELSVDEVPTQVRKHYYYGVGAPNSIIRKVKTGQDREEDAATPTGDPQQCNPVHASSDIPASPPPPPPMAENEQVSQPVTDEPPGQEDKRYYVTPYKSLAYGHPDIGVKERVEGVVEVEEELEVIEELVPAAPSVPNIPPAIPSTSRIPTPPPSLHPSSNIPLE